MSGKLEAVAFSDVGVKGTDAWGRKVTVEPQGDNIVYTVTDGDGLNMAVSFPSHVSEERAMTTINSMAPGGFEPAPGPQDKTIFEEVISALKMLAPKLGLSETEIDAAFAKKPDAATNIEP